VALKSLAEQNFHHAQTETGAASLLHLMLASAKKLLALILFFQGFINEITHIVGWCRVHNSRTVGIRLHVKIAAQAINVVCIVFLILETGTISIGSKSSRRQKSKCEQ
jgi:hypothetical protein